MQNRTSSYFVNRREKWAPARPRVGVMWLFLLCAFMSVVAGIVDVLWGVEFSFLFGIVVVALLLQWGFAALSLPSRLAATLSALLGVEYIVIRVGRLGALIPPCFQATFAALGAFLAWLWRTGAALFIWVRQWEWDAGWVWYGVPQWVAFPDMVRFAQPWLLMWSRMGVLLAREQMWFVAVLQDAQIFEEDLATLAWSLVIWVLACWAGWVTFRHHQALVAILPAGVTLAFMISYTGARPLSLLPVLFASLVGLAMSHHRVREIRWERLGIDYGIDLWDRLFRLVVPLALALVLVAAFVPDSTPNRVSKWLNDTLYKEERPLADSLGVEPKPAPTEIVALAPVPGLPSEHAVSGGQELSDRVVFYVQTSDMHEPLMRGGLLMDFDAPTYRWRSYTYDTYTGRGWVTTDTLDIAYPADTAITTTTAIAHQRHLQQSVHRVADRGNIVHAAGTIVMVDQAYAAAWRSEADFFGATVDTSFYVVDALVPTFTELELRVTSTDYPAWLQERYTQLPDWLPARVITLAQQVTVQRLTPYDKAVALEAFLRTYTYTLEVPAPPIGREVADYFLFDLQAGYCDYYATSMVVMARVVGLPARVVMGYVGGMFNPETAQYAVRESDAHAWAEVYFPEYGWIEFEPTSGRPAIARAAGREKVFRPQSPLPKPTAPITALNEATIPSSPPAIWEWGKLLLALVLLTGEVLLLVTLLDNIILLLWGDAGAMVTRLYHRLRQHANSLGVMVQQGDTPHELAAALTARLAEIAALESVPSVPALPTRREFLSAAPDEIAALVDVYVRAWYAPQPVDTAARSRAVWTWWKLRWRLWLAHLWRRRVDRQAAFVLHGARLKNDRTMA